MALLKGDFAAAAASAPSLAARATDSGFAPAPVEVAVGAASEVLKDFPFHSPDETAQSTSGVANTV